MVILMALALQSSVAPITSKTYEDVRVEQWTIKVNDTGCTAIDAFEEKSNGQKSGLLIVYNEGRNQVEIGFSHQKFKSIETGNKYKIKLSFVKGKNIDEGWGESEFTGVKAEGDAGGLLMKSYSSADMLKDLAISDAIGFTKDGIVVAAFPLQSMSLLLPKLKRCAASFEAENPTDPFAK